MAVPARCIEFDASNRDGEGKTTGGRQIALFRDQHLAIIQRPTNDQKPTGESSKVAGSDDKPNGQTLLNDVADGIGASIRGHDMMRDNNPNSNGQARSRQHPAMATQDTTGGPKSKIENRKSKIENRKSKIENRKSKISNPTPDSPIPHLPPFPLDLLSAVFLPTAWATTLLASIACALAA